MLYLIIILVSVILIALGNILFALPMSFGDAMLEFLASALAAAAVFAVDGIFAFIIRRLPEKWFSTDTKLSNVGKGERKLYRKLKVNAWKDKIPEWGGFTSFHKDRFEGAGSSEYLARFLLESNYGAVIHIANALLGFLIIFIPFCGKLSVSLPVIAVNFVLSILPVIVLRFNTAPLKKLYDGAKKKSEPEN